MKEIMVSYNREKQSFLAMVDDEDFDMVSKHKWCIKYRKDRSSMYARTSTYTFKPKVCHVITMHKLVMMNICPGCQLDHKDMNGLNNCKENLRVATTSQNNMNRTKQKNNTSGYKGVSFNKQKNQWFAQIIINKDHKWLGYFSNIIDAALAYDAAARKYFGEFARCNFPDDPIPDPTHQISPVLRQT